MPYPLRTDRLVIRPLAEIDVAEFVRYRQDPDVARWQSWTPDYSAADAGELLAGQPGTELPGPGDWLQLAVRTVEGGALLGDVAVHRLADQPASYEVGVTFARAAQGCGYAAEALRAVLDLLFTGHGAHRVVASCDARNDPVRRLLVRVGMRQESTQVAADWCKGEWTTVETFAVLRSEFRGDHRPDWVLSAPEPADGPTTGPERPMLAALLTWHRQTLLHVCAGLDAEQLCRRPVPASSLSLLGLVRHLTKVERVWLRQRAAGEPVPPLFPATDGPDADFDGTDPARARDEVERLRAEWAAADAAAAGLPLEHPVEAHGETLSLRMVYLHLIGEYARHNGHADLIRQSIDGVRGR